MRFGIFCHLRHLHCLTFDTCQVPTEALDFVSALTRHCLSGLDFVFLTWLSGLFCLALTCLSGILMPGKRCSRFASFLLCLAVALRRYQTYTATTISFQLGHHTHKHTPSMLISQICQMYSKTPKKTQLSFTISLELDSTLNIFACCCQGITGVVGPQKDS